MSHHEQQASERGNEQQHHELWPAYNLILVREQASTQVLFQQQLAVSQAILEMNHEQHWIVTAGMISGYIVIASFCVVATVAVYRDGFQWRYIGGLAITVAIIYGIMCELRAP
jgi:hypothetical protein